MSNQHLVKRDASFIFDPSKMKEVKKGDILRLIQTKTGGSPFKLDEKKRPIRISKGDVIWLMQTGYGVYAKSEITAISDTILIQTPEEFDRIRKENDPYLNDLYWRSVNSKFEKALKNRKPLHFIFVEHRILDNSHHYFVRTKPGAQNDWITFTNSNEIYNWITDQSPINYALNNNGDRKDVYGKISPFVKFNVSRIWNTPSMNENDFDHFVPRSVGGPGIFEENVVPMHFSINRAKSNRIPREFIITAYEYKERFTGLELTNKTVANWNHSLNRGREFEFQKKISKDITAKVSNWPEKEQRKFYFSILKKAFNSTNVITRIENTANKSIKDFSKEELIDLFESLRKELTLDLVAMFQKVNGSTHD